jgi:hypothetical protein
LQQRGDVMIAQVDGDEEAHRLRPAVGDRLPAAGIGAAGRPALLIFEHPFEAVGGAAQRLQADQGGGAGGIGLAQGAIEAAHLPLHQRQLRPQPRQHLRLQPRRAIRRRTAAAVIPGTRRARHQRFSRLLAATAERRQNAPPPSSLANG